MRTMMVSLAIMVASAGVAAAQAKVPPPAGPPMTAEQWQEALQLVRAGVAERTALLDRLAVEKRRIQAELDDAAAEYQRKQDALRQSARAIDMRIAKVQAEKAEYDEALATYPQHLRAALGEATSVENKLDAILDRLEKLERRLAEVERAKPGK